MDFPHDEIADGGGWYGQPGNLTEALGPPLRSQSAAAGLGDHPVALRRGVESGQPQKRGDRAEFVGGPSQSQRGFQALGHWGTGFVVNATKCWL